MSRKKKSTLLSIIIFILFWWLFLLIWIIKKVSNNKNSNNNQNQVKPQYEQKQLMSQCEKYFYDILTQNFSQDYIIMPQVNLASIINKNKNFPKQYQTELYRNIDFGLFDKNSMKPLLLIEINDKTHEQADRIRRDIKVKEICQIAQIKLITFYTKYDNKADYIVNRIQKELKS